jgi:hypothetical protein
MQRQHSEKIRNLEQKHAKLVDDLNKANAQKLKTQDQKHQQFVQSLQD